MLSILDQQKIFVLEMSITVIFVFGAVFVGLGANMDSTANVVAKLNIQYVISSGEVLAFISNMDDDELFAGMTKEQASTVMSTGFKAMADHVSEMRMIGFIYLAIGFSLLILGSIMTLFTIVKMKNKL